MYIFGVLSPLHGDEIKLLLIPSNTQHLLLSYFVVTATTCFGLSSDHRQVFAATLMYSLCLTSNVNVYIWCFTSVERWSNQVTTDIKGIVHKEFVLAGQTVNFALYCEVLRWLREKVLKLRPKLWRQMNLLLHHDNTPSQTYFFTRQLKKPNNMTERPPFWNNWGDGGRIPGGAEHPHRTRLPGCIYKLQKRWEQCIRAKGDYFEGECGQYAKSLFLTRWQHKFWKLRMALRRYQVDRRLSGAQRLSGRYG
jgi:hypothetical protein